MRQVFLGALLSLWALGAIAQEFTALARVDMARSAITGTYKSARVELGLSQPVPYRVFTLDAPRRLVIDFSLVAWAGVDLAALDRSAALTPLVAGPVGPAWSRLVIGLDAPLALSGAELRTEGDVGLQVTLQAVSAEAFADQAGAPPSVAAALPDPELLAPPRHRPAGERDLVVVLDPGHGGIDPGASRGDAVEKALMLSFARELREVLLRSGGFEVVMTRDDDIFVPLEMRQSIARAAGADVFLSLHADALLEGRARGATVYTLAEEATDIASEKLAERHDRADLLAGVDLSEQDDVVARLLMDLARLESEPRTDRLAEAIVNGLRDNIGNLHKRPRLEAAFSVLKSPDIPSVLIELGFMSSKRDLANLQSPEWRARAAAGIRDALRVWAADDAAEGALLRQ